MTCRASWILALACACTGTGRYDDDPEAAARPDTKALLIKTTVEARSAELVLSSRWSGALKLEGASRSSPKAAELVARGGAVLDLRELHVEADEIVVRFITDPLHEDILLVARQVKRFQQHVRYGHRTENADLVTMANDQVNIFGR